MCLAACSSLHIKMGINKWQEIETEDMKKVEGLESLQGSSWWSVDLNFEEVRLSRIGCRIHETSSSFVMRMSMEHSN